MSDQRRDIKAELNREGYSKEESYFYKMNRKLIQKIHDDEDLRREERSDQGTSSPGAHSVSDEPKESSDGKP